MPLKLPYKISQSLKYSKSQHHRYKNSAVFGNYMNIVDDIYQQLCVIQITPEKETKRNLKLV